VQNDFYQDSRTAYTEALCFRLSPDSTRARAYASTAERFIGAWVTQGFTDVSADPDVNLVFAGGFSAMTMAADLLAADAAWDPRPYRTYLVQVALAHNNPYSSVTNHSAWETMLRTVVGAYIDDGAMVDSMRQRWLFLADTQVAPDGSLRFEICRSNTQNWCGDPHMGINGLLYSNYDLAPMAVAGEVFAHRGVSVWGTSEGAKIGAAYATTAYWTLYPQASPYYAHNNGQLAAPAPPAFYVIFQRHYPSASGAAMYAQNAAKWWGTPYWTDVIYAVTVAD
jgi:Alginate lyase